MILKGNQRGGGQDMALHLLNDKDNEHVTVHEVSGFVADDVHGAFREIYAISKGTKATQYLYSLSLNPPDNKDVSVEEFEDTIERAEKKLGLSDQPRVIVFHEKEGRRHAHCAWSRIDVEKMKAINMSLDHTKLHELSRQIFLEKEWPLPPGIQDRNKANILNFTFAEYQEAKRLGFNLSNIKQDLIECWNISDNKRSFEFALQESGYYLARGKKHYMVIDMNGNTHSLPRKLGIKDHQLEARLGDKSKLPSIYKVQKTLEKIRKEQHGQFIDTLNRELEKQRIPLLQQKQRLLNRQYRERDALKHKLDRRWQEEEKKRNARVRHGFKGLWDKMMGKYAKTRRHNERETMACFNRDRKEQETLIGQHLQARQALQRELLTLTREQDEERKALLNDLSAIREEAFSKYAEIDDWVEEKHIERNDIRETQLAKRDKQRAKKEKEFRIQYQRYQAHIDKKTKESRERWHIEEHIKERDEARVEFEEINTPFNRHLAPGKVEDAKEHYNNMCKRLDERLWRHKDDILHINRNRKATFRQAELDLHGFGKNGNFEHVGQDIEAKLKRRHEQGEELEEEMKNYPLIDYSEPENMTPEEYREYQNVIEHHKQARTIDPEAGFDNGPPSPDDPELER